MDIHSNRNTEFCERLKGLGYTYRGRIRIYGEEFDLTSNPIAEESGFSIEAVSRKSGEARKLRIPLTVVQMVSSHLAANPPKAA